MKVNLSPIKTLACNVASSVAEAGKSAGRTVRPYAPAALGATTAAYVFYRTFQSTSMDACSSDPEAAPYSAEWMTFAQEVATSGAKCAYDIARQAGQVFIATAAGATSGLCVGALTFMATYKPKIETEVVETTELVEVPVTTTTTTITEVSKK